MARLKTFRPGTKVWYPSGIGKFPTYDGITSHYSVVVAHTVFGMTRLRPEAGPHAGFVPSDMPGYERYYEPFTLGRLWQRVVRGFDYERNEN